MSSNILARIAAENGAPRLAEILAQDLSGSDLQSLLLHVFQARAQRLSESDLANAHTRPLFAPSRIDARVLHQFDQAAFEAARHFEALDLSPVSTLGLNRVLGGIDQNNVLTTIRNAEVLGDPTPALALECARRRDKPATREGAVRLCASQRVIRLQPFDVPGFTPHFRLFALVSAGRDTGSHAFEMEHLKEHIRVYLDLCRRLNLAGFSLQTPLVEVSDTAMVGDLLSAAGIGPEGVRAAIRAHKPGESERFLAERGVRLPHDVEDPTRELPGVHPRHRLARVKSEVFDALAPAFSEARFRFNLARLEGLGYYQGLCLRISPLAPDGNRYSVIDGGFTDWTARLLQDRKERLLASGIGSQFACSSYLASPQP
ncbi:MAG TPA: hypothetical protein VKX49_30920 [Bryobacteraceae bacterium]|nr:hypothetical protein [Bryobacteraceae bacterium]